LPGSSITGPKVPDTWVLDEILFTARDSDWTASLASMIKKYESHRYHSFICHPNFDQHMRAYRFRDFWKRFP
jgi:hypothetical protein